MIENDFNAYIPEEYMENDTERLNIYKRLYDLKKTEDINSVKEELKDRFGEYLEDVENLFDVIEIKIIASGHGLEKISVHGRNAEFIFPADKSHRIFESEFFKNIIDTISAEKSTKYNIANVKDRLIIEIKLGSDEDKKRILEINKLLENKP